VQAGAMQGQRAGRQGRGGAWRGVGAVVVWYPVAMGLFVL